jgi:uncharacterized protein (DUF952 family)
MIDQPQRPEGEPHHNPESTIDVDGSLRTPPTTRIQLTPSLQHLGQSSRAAVREDGRGPRSGSPALASRPVVAVATATCHRGTVLIYKILLPAEWAEFEATGRFDGSPFDHSSGFIHCSSRAQVAATAIRVFNQEPQLVLVALDTQVLGDSVRWEQASDGGTFPHVYAPLTVDAVAAVHQVAGAEGVNDVLRSAG